MLDQLVESGLVDGNAAGVQRFDLLNVDVGTNDIVSGLRKAGPDDEANVSGSHDCDLHIPSGPSVENAPWALRVWSLRGRHSFPWTPIGSGRRRRTKVAIRMLLITFLGPPASVLGHLVTPP